MLDPKSTAGILAREHDTLDQAARYAERKAAALAAMHNGLACDYTTAAEHLRLEIAARERASLDLRAR